VSIYTRGGGWRKYNFTAKKGKTKEIAYWYARLSSDNAATLVHDVLINPIHVHMALPWSSAMDERKQ
jgi:hypothetical protein